MTKLPHLYGKILMDQMKSEKWLSLLC